MAAGYGSILPTSLSRGRNRQRGGSSVALAIAGVVAALACVALTSTVWGGGEAEQTSVLLPLVGKHLTMPKIKLAFNRRSKPKPAHAPVSATSLPAASLIVAIVVLRSFVLLKP